MDIVVIMNMKACDNFAGVSTAESLEAGANHAPAEPRTALRAGDSTAKSEWSGTRTDYPRETCIHRLFEEQAAARPEATALVFGREHLTYGELNERANRLAHYLHEELRVGPEVMVGLCMGRSLEMVIATLAILKAGGCYVPLDPTYPAERLRFLFADARLNVVLADSPLGLPTDGGMKVVCTGDWLAACKEMAADNLAVEVTAEGLAYVMYTSGSTGKPKGVLVNHRGVVRLVRNTNYIRPGPDDVFLQFAPISFDASTFEIWGSLLNGARLAIMSPGLPSLEELGGAIRSYGVTTLWLTGGLFNVMVDHRFEDLRPLRQLLAGGDVLSPQHVQKVLSGLPDCTLINGYGPTESTTFACCHCMRPGQVLEGAVPIGKPIANTQVYLLDSRFERVPAGVAGEICIGGDGLARGYLNRPELTAERFVHNPFDDRPGARLYKTGDLGRWRQDGVIEFLGRLDNQIKIRGFRVELGEIEAALWQHPAVSECVVSAPAHGGEKHLVAYVVPKGGLRPSCAELREFLAGQLPDHMVPSHYVSLPQMPLTAHGKIDRSALPQPDFAERETAAAYVAPQNGLEETIAGIWQSVLSVPRAGRDENFFEIGGTSLSIVRVQERLQAVLSRKVTIAELFQYPTISSLAGCLSQAGDAKNIHRRAVQDRAARQRQALTRGRLQRAGANG